MLSEAFSQVINALVSSVGTMGYPGIFILMAIESSFLPVPSEAVLIPAGVLVHQGEMHAVLVFLSATVGGLAGSLVNYFLARTLGRMAILGLVRRFGKYVLVKQSSIDKTETFFARHGEITIFTARLIPVVRHLISVPAGFAKMNVWKFSLFTTLGAGIWAIILIYAGYFFGDKQEYIKQHLTTISIIAAAIAVPAIGVYVVVKTRKKKQG